MTKPSRNQLVSIIMNCYNGEKYLSEAVDSILSQTYQNWELIFWDNHSVDNSKKIIKSYSDCRIKYIRSEKHTTLTEARNGAIRHSCGEFIAFLDVDDKWSPDRLTLQIKNFRDEDVMLVYGNYYIQAQGLRRPKYYFRLPKGYIFNQLISNYRVGLLTLLIRRKVFFELGIIFNENYQIIADYDLVLNISKNCKIGCTQKKIATYRIHADNDSNKRIDLLISEYEQWINTFKLPNTSRVYVNNKLNYIMANKYLKYQDKKSAYNSINKVVGFSPKKIYYYMKVLAPEFLLK
ncbi:glycosyltransferase [Polynucleobacter sp. Adler-ghost]|uniref:glycosyltransferase family 2 protein n=1 Tax=Polynucleobacter sp. Adler-ghost TaxID=2770234 RepID=UPI001BFE3866|nr:glycosyltransferase [Polynucleobacter sp. Adler-ghost]QWE31063.1 glycosyltransferase [Polynucleobacter sp. Adler-ghost]